MGARFGCFQLYFMFLCVIILCYYALAFFVRDRSLTPKTEGLRVWNVQSPWQRWVGSCSPVRVFLDKTQHHCVEPHLNRRDYRFPQKPQVWSHHRSRNMLHRFEFAVMSGMSAALRTGNCTCSSGRLRKIYSGEDVLFILRLLVRYDLYLLLLNNVRGSWISIWKLNWMRTLTNDCVW